MSEKSTATTRKCNVCANNSGCEYLVDPKDAGIYADIVKRIQIATEPVAEKHCGNFKSTVKDVPHAVFVPRWG